MQRCLAPRPSIIMGDVLVSVGQVALSATVFGDDT